jgi:hypothetical protein
MFHLSDRPSCVAGHEPRTGEFCFEQGSRRSRHPLPDKPATTDPSDALASTKAGLDPHTGQAPARRQRCAPPPRRSCGVVPGHLDTPAFLREEDQLLSATPRVSRLANRGTRPAICFRRATVCHLRLMAQVARRLTRKCAYPDEPASSAACAAADAADHRDGHRIPLCHGRSSLAAVRAAATWARATDPPPRGARARPAGNPRRLARGCRPPRSDRRDRAR